MLQLSIVMPAHNEADHIEQSVWDWQRAVLARLPESELIVVDDRSTDDTGARLDALATHIPALRVLHTVENVGHGRAVRLGLDAGRGEFIFQTDSDRQHNPEDFWKLWALRTRADFVFGVRMSRADGWLRVVISTAMRLINFAVWGHWIADANCPFKLMRRQTLATVLERIPRSTFIPMVMVSVLTRRGGFRFLEVPVVHYPRTAGQPSLRGIAKWLTVGWRCVRELVTLRLHLPRFTRVGSELP